MAAQLGPALVTRAQRLGRTLYAIVFDAVNLVAQPYAADKHGSNPPTEWSEAMNHRSKDISNPKGAIYKTMNITISSNIFSAAFKKAAHQAYFKGGKDVPQRMFGIGHLPCGDESYTRRANGRLHTSGIHLSLPQAPLVVLTRLVAAYARHGVAGVGAAALAADAELVTCLAQIAGDADSAVLALTRSKPLVVKSALHEKFGADRAALLWALLRDRTTLRSITLRSFDEQMRLIGTSPAAVLLAAARGTAPASTWLLCLSCEDGVAAKSRRPLQRILQGLAGVSPTGYTPLSTSDSVKHAASKLLRDKQAPDKAAVKRLLWGIADHVERSYAGQMGESKATAELKRGPGAKPLTKAESSSANGKMHRKTSGTTLSVKCLNHGSCGVEREVVTCMRGNTCIVWFPQGAHAECCPEASANAARRALKVATTGQMPVAGEFITLPFSLQRRNYTYKIMRVGVCGPPARPRAHPPTRPTRTHAHPHAHAHAHT